MHFCASFQSELWLRRVDRERRPRASGARGRTPCRVRQPVQYFGEKNRNKGWWGAGGCCRQVWGRGDEEGEKVRGSVSHGAQRFCWGIFFNALSSSLTRASSSASAASTSPDIFENSVISPSFPYGAESPEKTVAAVVVVRGVGCGRVRDASLFVVFDVAESLLVSSLFVFFFIVIIIMTTNFYCTSRGLYSSTNRTKET